MAEGRILVAATSATFDYEGRRIWLQQGRTTVREGHPILIGREQLFRPLTVDFEVTADAPEQSGKTAARPAARARKPEG